jgi:hypothetical protein
MVNWALYAPKEILQVQVHVGPFIQLTLEDNPFIDFIETTFVADKEGFITNAELLDLLDEHFKGNALQPLTGLSRKRAPGTILDLLKVFFKFEVVNTRVENRRGIRGIRLIDVGSDKHAGLPKISYQSLDMDPFSRDRIVPYEEIRKEIVFDLKNKNNASNKTQEKTGQITQPNEEVPPP